MPANLWASLLDRVVAPTADEATDDRSLRLVGDPQVLDQLVLVRPHTRAVTFEEGGPPKVFGPGDYLRPHLLHPVRTTSVLVVNTASVNLDVTVDRLLSYDRREVGPVTLRLAVQANDADDYAWLPAVAADHADGLEAHLLEATAADVIKATRSVVSAYSWRSLQDPDFAASVVRQWLPKSLAGGPLSWSEVVVLSGLGGTSSLQRDTELQSVWDAEVGVPLRGIAAAQVATTCSLIAVPTLPLSLEQADRVQAVFDRHFDTEVDILAGPAGTYAELLRTWFVHVEGTAHRFANVEDDGPKVLRIKVHAEFVASVDFDLGPTIGTRSQRAALRRLVPHRRVEFVVER